MEITLPAITPGEWVHDQSTDRVFGVKHEGNLVVATCHGSDGAEKEANALAIAAVPELLQSLDCAVRLLLHTYPNAIDPENPDPQIEFMLDSLRKAGATIED